MPILGKMLGEIKAKKIGEGFYSFQLNQPPELAEKVHSVGARIKAGEKITPPNKKLLGLWYVCPQCGQRVKRQIFRQVMITVGGVTTFAYYECALLVPSGVSGGGTANYLSKFTDSTTIGDSIIFEDSVTIM